MDNILTRQQNFLFNKFQKYNIIFIHLTIMNNKNKDFIEITKKI